MIFASVPCVWVLTTHVHSKTTTMGHAKMTNSRMVRKTAALGSLIPRNRFCAKEYG